MIVIKGLHKKYGGAQIHKDFSHSFEQGKMTAITGNSGIGKTTLLRCIAGLEGYEGDISIEGKVSYLFQEDRLMPWLSIADNLLLPIKLEGKPITSDIRSRMFRFAQFFNVDRHLDKAVNEVSGGEKQRLLMVRALMTLPDILLLDEPFKSLDETLYTEIFSKFKQFVEKHSLTVIFVTHHKVLAKGCDSLFKMS